MQAEQQTLSCDISGYLQQQYLDADGLYRYNKRYYRLCIADSTLSCAQEEGGEDAEIHDLTVAYSAKRLPSATDGSLDGVPFSLVWRSGKIWLFLAPSDDACNMWVNALDAAIHGKPPNPNSPVMKSSLHTPTQTVINSSRRVDGYSTKQLFSKLLEHSDLETDATPKQPGRHQRASEHFDSSVVTPGFAWQDLDLHSEHTNASTAHTSQTPVQASEFPRPRTDAQPTATPLSERPGRSPQPLQLPSHRNQLRLAQEHERQETTLRASADDDELVNGELERRMLQVEHDSYATREAAIQALNRQHGIELSMLRADQESQRKRFNDMFVRERQTRERAEEREVAAQRTARDWEHRYNRLYTELQELSKRNGEALHAWEEEKAKLTTEIRTLTRHLQEEVANSANRVRSEMTTELVATTQDYESRIEQTRQQVTQTARAEFEKEKVRFSMEFAERYKQELQAAVAAAQEQRVREVEAVRKTFLQREEQTAQDIEKLQSLHERRVRDVERLCDSLKQKLAEAQTRVVELTNDNQQCAQRARKDLEGSALHAQAAATRTAQLEQQLDQVARQKAEAESQQAVMRERLTQVLDERRIERAETLELKRQLTIVTAECDRFRHIAASTDHHAATVQAETQIMHEELAMLEHENGRLRRECDSLAQELSKVDKFLYGGKKTVHRGRSRR